MTLIPEIDRKIGEFVPSRFWPQDLQTCDRDKRIDGARTLKSSRPYTQTDSMSRDCLVLQHLAVSDEI